MSILTGTSKSRYPSFSDPTLGAGVLFDRAQHAAVNFLDQGIRLFEEQFVEDGVANIPGFSSVSHNYAHAKKPSRRHVFAQNTKATVFIKKRMFSSLQENYDVRFMSESEKLFIKASKNLFRRKTQDLAFYESLSNIESLFSDDGHLNIDKIHSGTLNSIFRLLGRAVLPISADSTQQELTDALANDPILSPFAKFLGQLSELKNINQRAKGNQFTTWISDPTDEDEHGLGNGVGVIELNMLESLRTSVNSSKTGSGSGSFSVQDPYRIMVISDLDIEIAMQDAVYNSPTAQLEDLSSEFLKRAQLLDVKLNELRTSRGASSINFSFVLGMTEPVGTVIDSGEEFTLLNLGNVEFTNPEIAIAQNILGLLAKWHTSQQRTLNNFALVNAEHSDLRQRMRNEYLGHSIVQQMDSVHIFMNSQTRDITHNVDLPVNLTDKLNESLLSQGDILDISAIRTEYESLGLDSIPFELYLSMRNRSVFRQDGVQVFCGLVKSINTHYTASNGVFTVDVTCEDNIKFLEMGKFSRNPSQAQVKAILHDPLTPFSKKVDPATGLQQGKIELNSENKKRLKYMRFDDGLLSGEQVTEQNIYQEKLVGGKVTTFQHIPGLIYKWKEGIYSESLDAALNKPLNSVGATVNDVINTYGVTVSQNPFGGLDAADTISLLVTGRPHNYASFFQLALDGGDLTLGNGKPQYFNYLLDFLERQSPVFGNFIPAVDSPIDPVIAAEAFKQDRTLKGLNSQLLKKERELAQLKDRQVVAASQNPNVTGDALAQAAQANSDLLLPSFMGVESSIQKLKSEIALISEEGQFGKNIGNDEMETVSLGVAGNDSYVVFGDDETRNVKNRLSYQLKKKVEDVRFNLDKNYLVVSEQYTSNTNIQAFVKNLKKGAPDLWNSSYESPKDLCVEAAESIGFEFFADSQGNIQFRPPQYNKTPLSLLLKIIALKQGEGVSYAPPFLDSLFKKRSDLILEQIVLKELQILEYMILLGEPVNLDLTTYPGKVTQAKGIDSMTFSISGTLNDGVIIWSADEFVLNREVKKLSVFGLEEQSGLRNKRVNSASVTSATSVTLINVRNQINNILGKSHNNTDPLDLNATNEALSDIEKQLSGDGGDINAQVNRLNIINKMASAVSARQRFVRSWGAIQDNRSSFRPDTVPQIGSSDSELAIPSSVAGQLANSGVDQTFPKFMEPLIENDLSNEDGFRSGKRFIIEDESIISMDLTVSDPDFNFVEVIGNQDLLNTTKDGGLGAVPFVYWAGAVDFDSWRRFGFRASQPVHRPDFHDPETQCAPYAMFKLQEQRRKIHGGSITVIGNEFYQAGDVVYVNNRSFLYYVESVDHSFNFESGDFQTTLSLSFGRALGEYIPTTLDVIGKGMIENTKGSVKGVKAVRSNISSNHISNRGTLFFKEYLNLNQFVLNTALKDSFLNSKTNKDIVKNVITQIKSKMNNSDKNVRIEIRTYYLGLQNPYLEKGVTDQTELTRYRANVLGEWTHELITSGLEAGTSLISNISDGNSIDSSKIYITEPINIDPDAEFTAEDKELKMFPSAKAWAGLNPFSGPDGVGLPLNAIDLVFVVEDNKTGDEKIEKKATNQTNRFSFGSGSNLATA